MPRKILTARSAVEKAEKATRAELDKISDQIDAGFGKVTDDLVNVVKAFRASHAELRPDKFGYPIDDQPSLNDMPQPTLPPNKNGDEFEYLDGVDAQGNNIPDCLEIDSDDVTPKALAELAMAAVRITKRHRETAEDMASFEETARRVLKRARIEGTIVEPPRDYQQEHNDQWKAWGEHAAARVHENRLRIRYYDRVGKNREQIWHLPKPAPSEPAVSKPAVPEPPTFQTRAQTIPAPKAARVTKAASISKTVPAPKAIPAPIPSPPRLGKIRIRKEKIVAAAAAAAATPDLSSSPVAIPSTSDASSSPASSPPAPPHASSASPLARLPSAPPPRPPVAAPTSPATAAPLSPEFPDIPDSPPLVRRQPVRRTSNNMKLPSSDSEDSD
ncbi:hypothetical protein B0T18DRAFT_394188 [Schizothecium vesticola]|uniref:Uncharacterized protein n=1 Tax=Schizothecium vesticola TaxID=314040 RepID=A0AA40EIE8_9PEZI|nr:hypothetical protein B0T18DRAFT_394188 [Schizothecium vesticola]